MARGKSLSQQSPGNRQEADTGQVRFSISIFWSVGVNPPEKILTLSRKKTRKLPVANPESFGSNVSHRMSSTVRDTVIAGGMDSGLIRVFLTCQAHNFQTPHVLITFSNKKLGLNGCHHSSALRAYQTLMKVWKCFPRMAYDPYLSRLT